MLQFHNYLNWNKNFPLKKIIFCDTMSLQMTGILVGICQMSIQKEVKNENNTGH